MMNVTIRRALGVAVMLSLGTAGIAGAEALKAEVSYMIVEIDDEGAATAVERDTVRPGEIIEYRIRHENLSDGAIGGLTVTGPIPAGTRFVPEEMQSSIDAAFEVQAEMDPELDGLEWSALPAFRTVIAEDGTRTTEPLPDEEVVSVRWRLASELEGGAAALNTYRVRVE